MQPFSKRIRTYFLALLVAAFFVIAPTTAFYAAGYRIDGLSFVQTGGLYVAVPVSGAEISINGKVEEVTNFLSRSVYIPDLPPGRYAVDIMVSGYYPWHKTLVVEPKIVTDVVPLLIPKELLATEILPTTPGAVATTTTKLVSRAEYTAIQSAFKATSTRSSSVPASEATSTVEIRNGQSLALEDGSVFVRWDRNASSTPSVFCIKPSSCTQEILVRLAGKDPVVFARFFEGGVVYATQRSGVFISDADVRTPQVVFPIYQKRGAEFRIVSGNLVVKDGADYYEIEGFR